MVFSTVIVFVIATVSIGREARRLDSFSPRATYNLEQAVQFGVGFGADNVIDRPVASCVLD